MSARLENVYADVGGYMTDILRSFKPGAKITVIVRPAGDSAGAQDFVMSNDDLTEVLALIQRRREAAK